MVKQLKQFIGCSDKLFEFVWPFCRYYTSKASTLSPGTKPLRRLEVQQGQNEIENNMQKLNPEINMKN